MIALHHEMVLTINNYFKDVMNTYIINDIISSMSTYTMSKTDVSSH